MAAFLNALKSTLIEGADSKKAMAALGSILTIISTLGINQHSMTLVSAIVISYIFGQGIADVNTVSKKQ